MVSDPVFWITVFSGRFEPEQPSSSPASVAATSARTAGFMSQDSDRRTGVFIGKILVISKDRLDQIPDMVS